MNLIWLKDDTKKDDLEDKKIICFGRNYAIICEMLKKYPYMDNNISVIIDNNPKTYGSWEMNGKIYQVCGPDFFENLNSSEEYAIVITNTYYNEVYEQLCDLKCVENKFSEIYIYVYKQLGKELYYKEKFSSAKLEDIILFRSGPKENAYVNGMDFADNARALFEYMLEVNYDRKYRLVWLVNDPDEFMKRYPGRNVSAIGFDWSSCDDEALNEKYYHDLFLAKYIFMTDAYGFASNCRSDQIRIQLWHGCGLKTRVNFARCEHRYEYNIVVSDKYKEIHEDIYGLRKDQVVITGYPKQDWLRKPYDMSNEELFGLKEAKKTIFWLPTFRIADDKLKELNQYDLASETSLPIVKYFSQLEELNEVLVKENINLIIKFHPFLRKENIKHFRYSNIVGLANDDLVENDLIINRLLARADALISDFSSAAVDYLALDRPIAFMLEDVEEYKNSRGFVFDNILEWLPGVQIYEYDGLVKFIKEIGNGIDSSYETRKEVGSKMNWFHDDQNSQRVIDQFGI